MPRIPTRNERQVFEQVDQGQGFKAKMGDTTSKTSAAGIFKAAAQVAEVVEQEKIRAEESQLAEYKTRLREKKIELTHDKDKGFFREKGKNAALNEKTYTDSFKQYQNDLMTEYEGASDRLKEKMAFTNQQFDVDLKGLYTQHTAREMQAYEDQTFSSEIQGLNDEAILEPQKIGDNLVQQKFLIEKYAKRKGLSAEKKQEIMLDASSKMHEGVIKRALTNGQDLVAKDYLELAKEREELDADTTIRLEKMVQEDNTKGESQRQTDMIYSSGASLGDMLAEARSIKDPDVRDQTVQRIKRRHDETRMIEKEQLKENSFMLAQEIDKYKNLDHLPPDQKAIVQGKLKTALDSYMNNMAKGHEPTTDPEVYYNLKLMAANPATRGKFLQTNLVENIHKLDKAKFSELINEQKQLAKGDPKTKEKLNTFLSDSQLIKNSLDSLGITDKTKRASFTQMVQDRVLEQQEETGKKVTQKEIQRIADTLGYEVEIGGGWFYNSKKKLYEVQPDEKLAKDYQPKYDDIPWRIRKNLETAIRKRGNAKVTKDQVEKAYLNYMKSFK